MRWTLVAALAACGGNRPSPAAPATDPFALQPAITLEQWYRSPSTCAQGPYAIEVPIEGARWGEEVELRVRTPRRIELHAAIVAEASELVHAAGVYDELGRTEAARPDNARCLADARERAQLAHASAAGGAAADGHASTGTAELHATAPPTLEQVEPVARSFAVLSWSLHDARPGKLVVRLWSAEPNDLIGVAFGLVRIAWRPAVSDAAYEAHLAAEQARLAADAQRHVVVHVETAAELRAREATAHAELIAAALEAERVRLRRAYCDAHHDDRDCWGAGGYQIVAELAARGHERDAYCGAHAEDARCWSSADWSRRRTVWEQRVSDAVSPPKPEGPPPEPLAEVIPPRLSMHADWRPGYWQWTEHTWVWLAGQWRVPDSDIVAEQTTTAPVAPPPPRDEVASAAPIRTAIWIAGFWQWSGKDWVWIAGSWQLQPDARLRWRAPIWRARGAVHVLIPGGWVGAR